MMKLLKTQSAGIIIEVRQRVLLCSSPDAACLHYYGHNQTAVCMNEALFLRKFSELYCETNAINHAPAMSMA